MNGQWDDNIDMILKEIRWEVANRNRLA